MVHPTPHLAFPAKTRLNYQKKRMHLASHGPHSVYLGLRILNQRTALKPQKTSNTWEIDPITSIPIFLAAVARHLATVHTVSFEIEAACPAARKVYRKHSAPANYRALRDTISPKTTLYYCRITEALAHDLAETLRQHDIKDVFWHLKGFDDQRLRFAIHDADLAFPVYLTAEIDSDSIHAIAQAVGKKPTLLHTKYEWDKDQRKK